MEKMTNASCMWISQCVLRIQTLKGEEFLTSSFFHMCNVRIYKPCGVIVV